MRKLTYDELQDSDSLIYKYIRGSHAYGLEKPDGTSDIDTASVYLEPLEQLLGLGLDCQEQVSDERQDNVAYSLKKFMNMLLSSNPSVLESLFIPERCILYEHPLMTEIKKHRDKFLTKACFKPLLGYSFEQIRKCRSLHKKFLLEEVERRKPLDFAYTFRKQGSAKMEFWLQHNGLMQKYCGLVNISHMSCMFGVFYDWGAHFLHEKITYDVLKAAWRDTEAGEAAEIIPGLKTGESGAQSEGKAEEARLKRYRLGRMVRFICEFYRVGWEDDSFKNWFEKQTPKGYKGMIEEGKSDDLKLSSVEEGILPICYMHYDKDKYSSHCRDYKSYVEWKKNRNPERYKENQGQMFDRKNVAHAVRLLHMGIEIARGEGFNVDRTRIDRDFILNIRLGNTSYEEIIEYIERKKDEMEKLIELSTLPDSIDVDFVNDLLLQVRAFQLSRR